MPIEGGLDGGQPQAPEITATPPAPAPSPSPSPSPQPSATPPAPAPSPSAAATTIPGGAGGQQAAAQAAFDLRAFANQHIPGVQQRYQSDQQLAQELINAAITAQQTQPYAAIGQRMAPHVQAFEQWMAEQQAAAQKTQQQQQQSWWQPPEYDPAWEKMVTFDAQGRMQPMPGAPLDIPSRIERYREFQRDTINKLTRDPIGTLKEGLLPMIREEAQRIAQQQAAAVQANDFANSYVERGIGWLAQKDAAGRPMRQANGAYVLTPAGARFQECVVMLNRSGVVDPRQQAEIAEKMVLGELAALQVQGNGQQQVGAIQPPPPQPTAFGVLNNPNYGATDAAKPGQSLKDMLWEAFEKNGVASRQQAVV